MNEENSDVELSELGDMDLSALDPETLQQLCFTPGAIPRFIFDASRQAADAPPIECEPATTGRIGHLTRREVKPGMRFDVLRRDGYRCQCCGATVADGEKLVVDHKVPWSEGGETVMSNLQTLCEPCNSGKRAKSLQPA